MWVVVVLPPLVASQLLIYVVWAAAASTWISKEGKETRTAISEGEITEQRH